MIPCGNWLNYNIFFSFLPPDGQRRLDGGQDALHDHRRLVQGQARRPGLEELLLVRPAQIISSRRDDPSTTSTGPGRERCALVTWQHHILKTYTEGEIMVDTRLGECCRQAETEEVSNSRNKIHQTTYQTLFPALYFSHLMREFQNC